MTKKILIIGGNGFLGFNLTNKLDNLGYKVSVLCKKRKKKNKLKNINYLYCNILNYIELKKKLNDDYDIVINFSGNINHKNKIETKKIHYDGVKNLIRILKTKKIKLFIQAGSSLEYGKCLSPQLEKNKCHPLSIYGKAKYLASRYLLRNKKKFTVIILRLYQVYGPYQKKDRLIPNVITNCLQNNLFNCTDGQQLRDFMYIDDLINLIVRIIKAKKNNSGIFNVGTSKPLKVRDVIEKIKAIIKKGKPNYGSITMRPDETEKLYPNIEKVCKKYNWIPKIKIINGLKKTINYYKKENSYKY